MVLMATDLPDPVVPATSRWGMRARSAMTGSPPMVLPRQRAGLCLEVSRPGGRGGGGGLGGEAGDDGLSADGLAEAEGELVLGGLEVLGGEEFAQVDGLALVVGQLDADGVSALDHGH